MAQNKTQATAARVEDYIAAIADPARRRDCEALAAMMARATGQPAVMWGPAIVGFGLHRYPLAGGKTGEICTVGFSSRKGDISLYGLAGSHDGEPLLADLGKHKLGKGCLYVARLADVDARVLEALVAKAYRAKQG